MSTSSQQRPPGGQVAYDDVDDLISTATRLMQKDAAPETLTTEDLKRIGEELDIPAEYIDKAMGALAQRREEQERERQAQEHARKARLARLRRSAWVAAGMAGVLALSGLFVRNGLNSTLADVSRQRAQVRNVVERRERVQQRYGSATPGPERDAELSGADNRVAVEQRRYDAAASGYNASASSFPTVLVVRLTGLPPSVPLSSEVTTW
jgi:hypothetical protein